MSIWDGLRILVWFFTHCAADNKYPLWTAIFNNSCFVIIEISCFEVRRIFLKIIIFEYVDQSIGRGILHTLFCQLKCVKLYIYFLHLNKNVSWRKHLTLDVPIDYWENTYWSIHWPRHSAVCTLFPVNYIAVHLMIYTYFIYYNDVYICFRTIHKNSINTYIKYILINLLARAFCTLFPVNYIAVNSISWSRLHTYIRRMLLMSVMCLITQEFVI